MLRGTNTYSEVPLQYDITLQAKYYARSNGQLTVPRKASDRMLVSYYNLDSDYVDNDLNFNLQVLFYTLNAIISIMCTCSVPNILQWIAVYSGKDAILLSQSLEFNLLYLVVTIVSTITNVTRTFVNIQNLFDHYYANIIGTYLPLMCCCVVLEVSAIVAWISIKKFQPCSLMFCGHQIQNSFVLKTIHIFAISQVFLFCHHIGCNLIVAIPYIAVAPAQALAAIIFIYSVLISTVLYLYYCLHHSKKIRCTRRGCFMSTFLPLCRLLVAFLLIGGAIQFLTLLTLIFNEFAKHGLSSSGLGSVILSFTPPTLVFILTMKFKPPSNTISISTTVADHGSSLTSESTNVMKASYSPTESTPLLVNEV